eukprot:2225320-Amphidinium_carterae.1
MLSGRCAWVAFPEESARYFTAGNVLGECCERLDVPRSGKEKLVNGTVVVPDETPINTLPGLQPAGHTNRAEVAPKTCPCSRLQSQWFCARDSKLSNLDAA